MMPYGTDNMSSAMPAGMPLMSKKRSSDIGGRLIGAFCFVRTSEARISPIVPVIIAIKKIVLNEN